ncbi:MAG: maleylpyruvate isomerase N-terminal domain-containing protein [Actinomycetota bacterium]
MERNAASRDRLRALAEGADEGDLQSPLGDGWTVAAVLAHLAFWDGWVRARWDLYARDGVIEDLPDGVVDLTNAAGLPQWLALAPRRCAELAVDEAEAVDDLIARLPLTAVEHVVTTGRSAMIDRSLHRSSHLDDIERAIARG